MQLLIKLLLVLLINSSLLNAMQDKHTKQVQAKKIEFTATHSIESYKKERDHDFIMDLLAKDTHNFPDNDKIYGLDDEYAEILGLTEHKKILFKQSISVYCIDGKPVGFIRTLDFGSDCGMIAQIAVKEDTRRMGIGEKLLRYSLERLKASGIKMIILETMADNSGARALYEKVGFTKMLDSGSSCLYSLQLSA